MAVSAREILLIFRGQNLMSGAIRSAAADLGTLQSQTNIVNTRLATQQRRIAGIVGSSVAQQQPLLRKTNAIIAERGVIEATQAAQAARFAKQREAIIQAEQRLLTQSENKQRSIGETQARISKLTTGSGAVPSMAEQNRLQGNLLTLANQRSALTQKELAQQSALRRATAQRLTLEKQLKGVLGELVDDEARLNNLADVGNNISSIRAQKLLAVRGDIERINIAQAQMPEQLREWNSKLADVSLQEQSILTKMDEQAVSIESASRKLTTQQTELAQIDRQLGGIKDRYDAINISEASGAAQMEKRLVALDAQIEAAEKLRDTLIEADAAGGAGGIGAALGFGGGGSRGIYIPGVGWGFRGRRFGGGLAALGSIAGLAGFGAERAVTSTLGIAGSLGGGLLGGGLLGAGVLGPTVVGMGTDLSGIGQAAGDIKTTSTNLGALSAAIKQYGANSRQATAAQATLNQGLSAFSPVARNAVLAAAQTSQGFKKMFDTVTGQAEKTGAEVINQAMRVGEKFLPTLGKFATQNLQIIQHSLQPLFSWLQQSGRQGGLGIFTNLEQIFQTRLPSSIHALSQVFELMLKTVDVAAQHTGGLAQKVDAFFTKWNQPPNFAKWSNEIGKLIGLFRTWMGLFGSIIHLVVALFRPAVGFGQQFAQTLTDIVNKVRQWLSASGTQNVLHTLFAAHTQQLVQIGALIQALLPLLESTVSAFLQMEAAMTQAFNNGLKPIIDAIKWLLGNPLVDKILGWVAASLLAQRAFVAVRTALMLLVGGDIIAGLRGVALGFLGIQTAAVKAGIASTEATAEVSASRFGIPYGLGGMLGRASLFAGGGLLAGGLIKSQIHGQAGSSLGDIVQGAGIGAGVGMFVGMPEVGAGIGALAGAVVSLTHNIPSLVQQLNKLGTTFFGLSKSAQESARNQKPLIDKLAELEKQAKLAVASYHGLARTPTGAIAGPGETIASSSDALANWTRHMQALANSVKSSNPKLMQVLRGLIDIRNATGRLPTRKEFEYVVRVVVKGGQQLANIFHTGPGGLLSLTAPWQKVRFPAPPINLSLPPELQFELTAAQAGHGSIEKADAAAYAYYEKILKRHDLTRKQILAIYKAEMQYAPYQTPSSLGGGKDPPSNAMLQAAVTAGIKATARFSELYYAAQAAQKAFAANPNYSTESALVAANNALSTYESNVTSTNRAIASSTQQTFQDVVNSVTSMYQQLLQQNQQNFGTLFQGPFIQGPQMQNFTQWGGKLTGKDLTRDLHSQITQYRNFNRLLTQLQRRGAPQELINQLRALGPAAIQQIRALTQMSGPELRKYFNMFQEGQKAIHQQTMRQLNRQLRDYLKYGRNIALQMIAGIRQESPGITKAIERAVRRAFGNFGSVGGGGGQAGNNATNAVTHHHHHRHRHQHHHRQARQMQRTTQRHHQRDTATVQRITVTLPNHVIRTFETKHIQDIQGRVHIVNPVRHIHATIDSPKQPWRVRLEPRHRESAREIHHHYEYKVTAPKDSSIDTQVRHAHFHNRNKHRRQHGVSSDRYR